MAEKRLSHTFLRVILVVGILFFFLVAINLLGSSFKLLGNDYIQTLFTADISPFAGLFIGILSTVLVQSSSVTTSIIVGLVSGGVISVESAIPMVMGANIGTTVTNLIVSFGHVSQRDDFRRAFSGSVIHDFFNLFTVIVFFPLELFTGFLSKSAHWLSGMLYGISGYEYESPIKVVVKSVSHAIQNFGVSHISFSKNLAGVLLIILSLVVIFACLFGLVKLLKTIMMGKVVSILNHTLAKSALITITIGVIITALVQSSSVTTSLLVPLIGGGVITLEVAFPIILGANVGTTITALLAAMAGTEAGLTIALVHLLFNVCGILLIYPFKPIRNIPLAMARWMGNLVFYRRKIAVIYVLLIFFVIPFIVVIL